MLKLNTYKKGYIIFARHTSKKNIVGNGENRKGQELTNYNRPRGSVALWSPSSKFLCPAKNSSLSPLFIKRCCIE